jgi:DNA polymerase-3 subunit epsilon
VKNLKLSRSLVFLDLETTGSDPATDRIVEIAALRIDPDGSRQERSRRVNPGRPIPSGASAVHGIYDDDVRHEPAFGQIARGFLEWLGSADLAGFNLRRFDLPLLERELGEAGLDLGLAERRVVDVMTIYHMKERRDLSAAVRFYLGREHAEAHAALSDAAASAEVLDAQLARYSDLPRTVEELDALGPLRGAPVDAGGKFIRVTAGVVFAFGKHQGRTIEQVAAEAPGYLQWILEADFPEDAKSLVRVVLAAARPRDQSV